MTTCAPSIISATAGGVGGGDPSVDRPRGRRHRVRAEVDVPELLAEAANELLAEPLIGIGSVLDDDHLVVEVVNPALVAAGQRVEGPPRLATHVVDDDDDGELGGLARFGRVPRG